MDELMRGCSFSLEYTGTSEKPLNFTERVDQLGVCPLYFDLQGRRPSPYLGSFPCLFPYWDKLMKEAGVHDSVPTLNLRKGCGIK